MTKLEDNSWLMIAIAIGFVLSIFLNLAFLNGWVTIKFEKSE